MKGLKYAYYPTEGGRRTYRHALWIPQEKILFQWVPMSEVKQVMGCESFPPPGVDVEELDEIDVPKDVVLEAQRYLAQQSHLDAQERSVSLALQRIRGLRMMNEYRAQEHFRSVHAE